MPKKKILYLHTITNNTVPYIHTIIIPTEKKSKWNEKSNNQPLVDYVVTMILALTKWMAK